MYNTYIQGKRKRSGIKEYNITSIKMTVIKALAAAKYFVGEERLAGSDYR